MPHGGPGPCHQWDLFRVLARHAPRGVLLRAEHGHGPRHLRGSRRGVSEDGRTECREYWAATGPRYVLSFCVTSVTIWPAG